MSNNPIDHQGEVSQAILNRLTFVSSHGAKDYYGDNINKDDDDAYECLLKLDVSFQIHYLLFFLFNSIHSLIKGV